MRIIAHLPRSNARPFIARKRYATQNVSAVCLFHMTFGYVVAHWEGTTQDSRVFNSVIKR